MRRRTRFPWIILVLLACSTSPVQAASIAGYELQAGGASSSFQGDLHDAFGASRSSFTAGAALRIRCNDVLSLQPELRWIQKGGSTGPITFYTGPGVFTFPELEWVVNYLDVPLLARLDAPASGGIHPYLLLGTGVALKVGGEVQGDEFENVALPRLRYAQIFEGLAYSNRDIVDHFQDIDLDATIGVGLGLGRGANRVTVEARWIEGLLDPTPDGSNVSARNRAFTATLGYAWR